MKLRTLIGWLLSLVVVALIAGCGGGGGGGGAVSGAVSMFMTDDLNAGYDSVWVAITRVELISASGSTVVFDDSTGKVVDVRALNQSGTQQFLHLGDDKVPAGDYTGARVTMKKDLVLFPTGATTGQNREFAGLNGSGLKVIDVVFSASKSVGAAKTRMVLDFDLSKWTDDGTKVQSASIDDGSTSGLDDPARHEEDDYHGTITGLTGTAPALTFTLNSRAGNTITVTTDASTAIYNGNGATNPSLANGKRVEVRGVFDPGTSSLAAASIKIKGSESEDPHQVKGPSSNLDEANGTLVVDIRESEGFVPDSSTIKVHADPATTRFRSHGGLVLTSAEFFAVLAANPGIEVEAEGTVSNGAETILEATSLKIEDENEDESGEAEAKGTVTAADGAAGTMNISVIEWEGFQSSSGAVLAITTDGNTHFMDDNGASLTKEQFFAAATVGKKIEVKGDYTAGTIAAMRIKIEDLGSNEAEAKGTVTAVNGGSFVIDISLMEWFGFSGSHGLAVHVDAGATTNFRDKDGNTVTRDQFFALVGAGDTVEVKGTYSSSTQTITAVRVKMDD
ncbi:MAG: DUF4382 domain-containing protein [Armatimonadetes bacterium]|nr:DUF4382 domain-containing protein [Armatimonadota bacterium]